MSGIQGDVQELGRVMYLSVRKAAKETPATTVDRVKIPFHVNSAVKFSSTIADYVSVYGDASSGDQTGVAELTIPSVACIDSLLDALDMEVPDTIEISQDSFKSVIAWMHLHRGSPASLAANLSGRNQWRTDNWSEKDQFWAVRTASTVFVSNLYPFVPWAGVLKTAEVYNAADYLGVDLLVDAFGSFLRYFSALNGYDGVPHLTADIEKKHEGPSIVLSESKDLVRNIITGALHGIDLEKVFSPAGLNSQLESRL